MFTGITRGLCKVVEVERRRDLLRYQVDLGEALSRDLQTGASVAIDGVCQTVVSIRGDHVTFEAIRETLDRTTLDAVTQGARVSVERSFRVGDEIGGHELSGHVTGTGVVAMRRRQGDVCDMQIRVPGEWMKYILPKGFVGVDGSSLTVGKTHPDGRFDLHLIPETLRLTQLGDKPEGGRVNIELDSRTVAVVATVERVLAARDAQGAEPEPQP